ncbi:VapE domain-containing protein [Streptococcus saliviloxodontae]|uniref:P-loop ATPase n=1 Tax=Streptococcus saliviloxodontae TaxID=1349416 RepID=A0ABS2PJZ2_9STRE|nr:VapE domain-containing protein [Streptococcus saliviloxodontae]MBM7635577.1 putative P-loop ATPase [Streptococcus saliviloxodontae]
MSDIIKQLIKLTDKDETIEQGAPKVEQIEKGLLTYKDKAKTQLKKTNANLIMLFKGADSKLSNLFQYNERTKQVEIKENRDLGNGLLLKAGKVGDNELIQFWGYLAQEHNLEFTPDEIYRALHLSAIVRSYNPIKTFLKHCYNEHRKTDPFKIITKYIKVEDTKYNRLAFDLIFRGAIARVLEPGIQFDYCLDLVGRQGTGKTTFLREVFNGFYGEISTFTEKDDVLKMLELWAVNDDELVASHKIKFNDLKQKITEREIMIRRPYLKGVERIPVDFIYTRTTNDKGHLKDATGDRRFLPVEVLKPDKPLPNIILKQDLRDIWGNYYQSYLENPKLFYYEDSVEGRLISSERERYKARDDIIERLERYIETPIPADFYERNIEAWMRTNYYYYLEEKGAGYRRKEDFDRGDKWVGTLKRDRISLSKVTQEIFSGEKDRKLKSKIKLYMDNLDGWEYRKRLRFGDGVTSGWFFVGKH